MKRPRGTKGTSIPLDDYDKPIDTETYTQHPDDVEMADPPDDTATATIPRLRRSARTANRNTQRNEGIEQMEGEAEAQTQETPERGGSQPDKQVLYRNSTILSQMLKTYFDTNSEYSQRTQLATAAPYNTENVFDPPRKQKSWPCEYPLL
ncbi:hypothetical protein NLI96_g12847 [Meripilus lineatus]|uniref:Uncharacterized protein n=1 Tax=Meripilus lineatus TaxID=2056292 RepID=A0AAD5Y7U4_9APHY|nr:hypothetical protein NLI96_g12847 [Physisporinus lineatus]